MMTFILRRVNPYVVWAVFSILIVIGYEIYSVFLHPTRLLSGWLLFVFLLGLTLFHARKKLPFLPLGTSTNWLRSHISIGFLTVVLFGLHLGLRVPDGVLEMCLAINYLAVAGSGILGLAISRGFPRRLTARGEEVLFERIPAMRKHLREKVQELIIRAASESGSTAIADFSNRRLIATRLIPFFDGPRNIFGHLLGSDRALQALLTPLQSQDRYLSTQERQIAAEIDTLIRTKDDLDYQYAHQGMLKYWLFLHIPLTYSLLILSLFHAAFASAFRASIP